MSNETKPPESTGQPSEPPKPSWWDDEPKWMGEMREMLNPDPDKEEERRERNLRIHKQQLDAAHGVTNVDNGTEGDDPFEIVSVEELPELIEDAAEPVKETVKATVDAIEKAPEKVHALFRQWGGKR